MKNNNKKYIFLDRDGTITKYKGFITNENQVELEAGAAEGIKILNDFGFGVIVATNQPQVARGMCSEGDIEKINRRMMDLLKKKGARIDAVYVCPHHPETHHKDIPPHAMKYRIDCDCRKPKIGMLKKAAEKFGIDLKASFMVGDRTVDIETGKNAGCATILLKSGEFGNDDKDAVKADYEADNLESAAKFIVSRGVTAVILAGGRGERLRPLTDDIPKPMVEISGKPLLWHQIEALRKSGITEVVICASYLADKIKEYFGSGKDFGVNIHYPKEPKQLGSGVAVKNAEKFLRGAKKLLIMNGDKMIGDGFDFFDIIKFDAEKNGFCTILARETDHPEDSDIIMLDGAGRVVKFLGRGQREQKISNSGAILASPALLQYIPEGTSNIEKDVIFTLLGKKDIYGFVAPKNWFIRDIGTPERLEATRRKFESGS